MINGWTCVHGKHFEAVITRDKKMQYYYECKDENCHQLYKNIMERGRLEDKQLIDSVMNLTSIKNENKSLMRDMIKDLLFLLDSDQCN